MIAMKNEIEWSKIFSRIQRHFNNFISIVIDKTFNEIFYDFTSIQAFDL